MAHYRVGHDSEAVDALRQAEALNAASDEGPLPTDQAFLAMALKRLGRDDESSRAFQLLREVMKRPEWERNTEVQSAFHEAELALGGASVAGASKPR